MPWAPTSTSESLVSVTDYMTWYNIGTASTDDQARIQMALDMASAECRAYTAQFITPVSETITTYPMNVAQNQLVLPQWPVTAIASVTVDGNTLTELSDYIWTDRGIITLRGSFCLGYYYGLPRTVTVTYTHGWNPIPGDIAEICLGLAKRNLDAPNDQQIEKEAIGSYSVTYSTLTDGLSPAEKTKLDRYASWTIGY